MSETSTARPADERRRPIRLLGYYGLLMLFIWLLRTLLSEVGRQYNLEQFSKIKEIVKLAVSYASTFDDVVHTIFSLFLSFVFTLPLGWVYTMTKDDDDYDVSLVQTLVALSMAVTGVMIVIGNELARAFSLAGVVAAVRFRNTLDDAKDGVYIFIAIAIGMACGSRTYAIATWLSMIMTGTMYLLWRSRFGDRLMRAGGRRKKGKGEDLAWVADESAAQASQHALSQQVRLLQWASLPSKDKKVNSALVVDATDLGAAQRHVDAALSSFGGKWRLAGVKTDGNGGEGVLEYVGRLPKEATAAALVTRLRDGMPATVSAIEFRSLKGLRPLGLPGAPDAGNGTA